MSTTLPDVVTNVDLSTMQASLKQQLAQCICPGMYSYELVFPNAPDLYCAGGALRHLFGVDFKELTRFSPDRHVFSHVYPEDIPVWLQFLQGVETGMPMRFDCQQSIYYRHLTLDGRQLQVMHQRKPFMSANSRYPAAMVWLTVDVSHLRPANAPACITTLDMTDAAQPLFAVYPTDVKTPEPLTFRELSILELLADGKTSKQAAYSLKISPNTIDTHRRRILMKTKTSSITEAVAKAIRNGWFIARQGITGTI